MRGTFLRVVFPPETTKFLSKIRIFLINSTDFQKSTNIGKFYIGHEKNYFISWQIISFSNTLPSWTKVSYIIKKFTNRVQLIPKLHEKVLEKDWYITGLDIINNSKIQKHELKDACKKRYIKVKSTITRYVKFCCFFYHGFLSQTLTIHRTAEEGRRPSFTPLYQFHADEHWNIYLQLCMWDDSMRFTTLSNYHLIYWLAMQY